MKAQTLAKLPKLLERKIYKTGQTRGADDDEIYQNRVGRNCTVLIPYAQLEGCKEPESGVPYENGFIVLISPKQYFGDPEFEVKLKAKDLVLGKNALIFYEQRADWLAHPPSAQDWTPAESRKAPLAGEYVARIPANTAREEGEAIRRGFTAKKKGAGIRVYEYASKATMDECRLQLEALFWLCRDAIETAVECGMSEEDAELRKAAVVRKSQEAGLLNVEALRSLRVINREDVTVCPLCLAELSSRGFVTRLEQAPGREVHDLTVTQLNLFHISELKHGRLNHNANNLGWGHHHCNVVAKDSGIEQTLDWMRSVLARNEKKADG